MLWLWPELHAEVVVFTLVGLFIIAGLIVLLMLSWLAMGEDDRKGR